MYKANAFIAIINGKLNQWRPSNHNACRLGQWYFSGVGKERFSQLEHFKAIARPHELVHKYSHENLKFIENGDHSIEHRAEIISNFVEMEKASDELFHHMDELIKESETIEMH
jgi:hypothetical protein